MVHVYVSTRLSAGHVLAQTGMGERDVWNVRREGLGKAARWNAVAKHVSMESARRRAHVNAMRASRGMTVSNVKLDSSGQAARSIAIRLSIVGIGDGAESRGSVIAILALPGRSVISATMGLLARTAISR